MGRYYKQALPTNFGSGSNSTYTPPWELIQGIVQKKDAAAKQAIAKSELLEGAVDEIPHLNTEADNEIVRGLQNKYRGAVDNIAGKIAKDPLNANKYKSELKRLKRSMLSDRSTGEWSQVEGRNKAYSKWLKDNEKLRKEEPALFNELNQHWYEDISTRSAEDPRATFRGTQGIGKIDLIRDYKDLFKSMKSNTKEGVEGKYIVNNKSMSEEEVSNLAWSTLLSDPNYEGYALQMGQTLGKSGYIDTNEEGRVSLKSPFQLKDKEGKIITYEEYEKLDDTDKAQVNKVINPDHAYSADLSALSIAHGFSEETIKADPFAAKREAQDIKREDKLYDLTSELQQTVHEGGDEGKQAEKALNVLNAKTTVKMLGRPDVNMNYDRASLLNKIDNNYKKNTLPDTKVKASFYLDLGTEEYAAYQRMDNASQSAIKSIGKEQVKLSNGVQFSSEDYFNFLGEKEPSKTTAREFLNIVKDISVPTVEDVDAYYNKLDEEEYFGDMSKKKKAQIKVGYLPQFLKQEYEKDVENLYELGNKFEEEKEDWYNKTSTSSSPVNTEPITDLEILRNLNNEMKNNSSNFYVTNSDGDIEDSAKDIIDSLSSTTPLSVLSSNSHSEMGIRVNMNDEDYYIFPTSGNFAQSNTMKELSLKGVNRDSQYYREMTNRAENSILRKFNKTGRNTKETKSTIMNVKGHILSLELDGNIVNVRNPDMELGEDPIQTFKSVEQFVKSIY